MSRRSTTRSPSRCCSPSRPWASAGSGEAPSLIADGAIRPGGSFPLNTSGGGLSYCHPGQFGVLLLVEAVRQLRGEAGARQVPGAEVALAHGTGGILSTTPRCCWGWTGEPDALARSPPRRRRPRRRGGTAPARAGSCCSAAMPAPRCSSTRARSASPAWPPTLGGSRPPATARVDSFTVVHRARPRSRSRPRTWWRGCVLEEGPIVLSRLVGDDVDAWRCDDPVSLHWEPLADGRRLPVFGRVPR